MSSQTCLRFDFFITCLTNSTTNKSIFMAYCLYESERLQFALNNKRASWGVEC